jgi:two-component system, sensor histidine kinase and response regulator
MKKVLLIEDELVLRDEVADWLRFENYDVSVAGNGVEGLEMVVSLKPDLILCDIMMPLMDGKRLLFELRAKEETSMVPFVFMSALSEREHIRDGMVLGADDYLTKPFTRKELLSAVESRLRKYAAMEEKTEKAVNSIRNKIISYLPHELRTPLNGIIGYSSMLSEMAEDFSYAEIGEMGRNIADGGKRLHRLIENYLLYIQLELMHEIDSGIVEKENLEAVIFAECFQIANKYSRKNNLQFKIMPASVKVDEIMLRKIIYELVDNAFKFSLPESMIEVEGKVDEAEFSLSIKNIGVGFSKGEIDQIGAFMQFGREKNEQQGSGLGLILIKRMLELAGGSLQIKSVQDEYTEVTCRFPIV